MPRPKAIPTEEQGQEVPPPPEYNLEPINEDIESRIIVWGNSTQMLITQLRPKAPEWAALFNDMFETVGTILEIERQ